MYKVICVKKHTDKNGEFDHRLFVCYSSEPNRSLVIGQYVESLKMKYEDFTYVLRSRGYNLEDLPGAYIEPSFDRYGFVRDFELKKADENGEIR